MHRKVGKGCVDYKEGIFYTQVENHAYLKLLVYPSMRQKKTTVGLEIAIIMSV